MRYISITCKSNTLIYNFVNYVKAIILHRKSYALTFQEVFFTKKRPIEAASGTLF